MQLLSETLPGLWQAVNASLSCQRGGTGLSTQFRCTKRNPENKRQAASSTLCAQTEALGAEFPRSGFPNWIRKGSGERQRGGGSAHRAHLRGSKDPGLDPGFLIQLLQMQKLRGERLPRSHSK